MTQLRIIAAVLFVALVLYTLAILPEHGADFISVFFGNIWAMNWSGQINLDFSGYVILSALWIGWRHNYTPAGLGLGAAAFLGGMFFFPYLIYLAFTAKDARELLLGPSRV